MAADVGIFVATMTGLAAMCAEEIEAALAKAGRSCRTQLMDGLDAVAIAPFKTIIIVSSTYGCGDIPDNGQAFFRSIEETADLSGVRFAVFGLGDRTYKDTFCAGGAQWDALLAAKGASRILPLERHDASSGTLAEDEAAVWARSLIPLLEPAFSRG